MSEKYWLLLPVRQQLMCEGQRTQKAVAGVSMHRRSENRPVARAQWGAGLCFYLQLTHHEMHQPWVCSLMGLDRCTHMRNHCISVVPPHASESAILHHKASFSFLSPQISMICPRTSCNGFTRSVHFYLPFLLLSVLSASFINIITWLNSLLPIVLFTNIWNASIRGC